jgi:hypothetical protein
MNYQHTYNQLIAKAQARNGVAGYCERHHITPRSLGGSDEKTNIVALTAREHFVAHMLLAKVHGGNMWYAVLRMKGQTPYMNSRLYNAARILYGAYQKDKLTLRNPMHDPNVAKKVAATKRSRQQYANPWGKYNALHATRMQDPVYAQDLRMKRKKANAISVLNRQITNCKKFSLICALKEQNCNMPQIAKISGIPYGTVYKVLRATYA